MQRRGAHKGYGSQSAVSRRVAAAYSALPGDARACTMADCRVELGLGGVGDVVGTWALRCDMESRTDRGGSVSLSW